MLKFKNFIDLPGQQSFILKTSSRTSTAINVPQTEKFQFSNWKINEISADIAYLDCESGKIEQIEKSLQVVWEDISSGSPKPLKKYTSEKEDKQSIFEIPKYNLSPGGNYTYQLTIFPEGKLQEKSSQKIQFITLTTPLTVYIKGGNKMHGYSSPLKVEAIAKDLDVAVEEQENNIFRNWTCKNLAKNDICKRIDDTPLKFNNSLTLNYPAKIFEPYSSIQMNLEGVKSPKTASAQAIIVIVETGKFTLPYI